MFDIVLFAVSSILNCLMGSIVLLKVKFSDELVLYIVFNDGSLEIQPLLLAILLMSFWLPNANGSPGDNCSQSCPNAFD